MAKVKGWKCGGGWETVGWVYRGYSRANILVGDMKGSFPFVYIHDVATCVCGSCLLEDTDNILVNRCIKLFSAVPWLGDSGDSYVIVHCDINH